MWYVIQVLGGQEKATLDLVQHFVDGGILKEAFIPQREVMRHRSGAWVKVREILFPGYLIVITRQPNELFAQLMKVPAFTRLLGSDDAFVPLTREEVNLINAFVGGDHVAEMSEGIIEGDEVHIMRGPLRGYDAVITRIDRHKRVANVKMCIFGREVDIKLGLEIARKL